MLECIQLHRNLPSHPGAYRAPWCDYRCSRDIATANLCTACRSQLSPRGEHRSRTGWPLAVGSSWNNNTEQHDNNDALRDKDGVRHSANSAQCSYVEFQPCIDLVSCLNNGWRWRSLAIQCLGIAVRYGNKRALCRYGLGWCAQNGCSSGASLDFRSTLRYAYRAASCICYMNTDWRDTSRCR